jgi:hypothetical protein
VVIIEGRVSLKVKIRTAKVVEFTLTKCQQAKTPREAQGLCGACSQQNIMSMGGYDQMRRSLRRCYRCHNLRPMRQSGSRGAGETMNFK